MASLDRSYVSCGIYEFSGINFNSPEVILHDFCLEMREGNTAYVMFSTRTDRGILEPLVKYLRKNKLGKCHLIKGRINPNTAGEIGMIIWEFDKKKFGEWRKKNDWLFPENTLVKASDGKSYIFNRWHNTTHHFTDNTGNLREYIKQD